LRNAAGSANVSRLSVFAANHHFSLYFHSHKQRGGARDNKDWVATQLGRSDVLYLSYCTIDTVPRCENPQLTVTDND
jgi:hypothetical protein